MKALITGISGFGGSHLTEELLSCNYTVFGMVRPDEDLTNIYHLQSDLKLEIGDLKDGDSLKTIMSSVKPDMVFHLAAEASAHKSFEEPLHFFEINVMGTIRLLQAIRDLDPFPRVVLVTSSEIYGYVTPEEIPISEEQKFRPESPYAVSKVTVAYLGRQFFRNFNIPIIEARAFNHIGPRQTRGFVVPDFCEQIAKIKMGYKEPVIEVGNLSEKRDFVDVKDVVRAYRMIAERGIPGEGYNISSNKSVDIETLLKTLIAFSDKKISVVQDPNKMRPSRMPEIRGDNSKIKNELGWEPTINLNSSLAKSLEYWQKRIDELH